LILARRISRRNEGKVPWVEAGPRECRVRDFALLRVRGVENR
jgi:hypothetical protein